MTTKLTVTVWAASIAVQAVLLFLLVRRGHYRRLPLFTAWMLWDWLRSAIIFAAYVQAYRSNKYAVLFAVTEPIDMLLLAGAGIEAAGSAAFGWGLAVALAAGTLMQFPDTALPLRTQFLTRALVAGAVASSLVIRSTVSPSWHRSILLLFCVVDLTTYLAIVLFWPAIDRAAIHAFVMCGQSCCLIAWTVLFARR